MPFWRSRKNISNTCPIVPLGRCFNGAPRRVSFLKQFQKVLNEISFTRVLDIAGIGRSLFLHKSLESGDYA